MTADGWHDQSLLFLVAQECPFLQFAEGVAELLLGVHHDRSVPSDGLFERLAGDEQKADAIVASLHHDFVTAIEEDQLAVLGCGRRRGIQPVDRLGGNGEGLGGVAEFSASRENVSESVTRGLDRQRLATARWNGNVEVNGIGSNALDRPPSSPEVSAHY